MPIEEDIRTRLQQLFDESTHLSQGYENGQCTDPIQMRACSAWLTCRPTPAGIAALRYPAPALAQPVHVGQDIARPVRRGRTVGQRPVQLDDVAALHPLQWHLAEGRQDVVGDHAANAAAAMRPGWSLPARKTAQGRGNGFRHVRRRHPRDRRTIKENHQDLGIRTLAYPSLCQT